MPLPPRPLGGARGAARPPRGEDSRARHRTSPASFRSPGRGTRLPRPAPTRPHAQGAGDPATHAGPRTPGARPRPPGLAAHDLVLVRDELVYIFQVKLVRHGRSSASRHNRSSRRRETSFLPPGSRVVSHGNRGDALRWPAEGQTSLGGGAGEVGGARGSGRGRGAQKTGVVRRVGVWSPDFQSHLGRFVTEPGQNT